MANNNSESEVILSPVTTHRASEAIYDQIKNLIISGELKPGDRLPSERNLMTMLQRSRPPIREALRMLERSGLIKTIPGSGGAVVMKVSSKTVEQPLENMISLNQISHRDLLEYRELNEVAFTGWAAERRNEDELAEIADCIKSAEASINDFEAFINFDIKFHELVAAAGHNRIICIVNRVISRLIFNILRSSFLECSQEERISMFKEILEMHKQVYEAISAQDKEKAQDLMRHHIKRFEGDLHLQ